MLLPSPSTFLCVLVAVRSALGFVPAVSNATTSRINATNPVRQSCPYLSPHSVLSTLGTQSGTGNPIYPPGYLPGISSYWYPVPGTSVTLKCGSFEYHPQQNSTQIDNVLIKVLVRYGNARQRGYSVFDGRHFTINIEDGFSGHGKTVLGLHLSYPPFPDPFALKYREVVAGARGLDFIRRHFPWLDMCCSIMIWRGQNELVDHGLVTLHKEDRFEAEDASV